MPGPTTTCSACGAPLPPGAAFCGRCGLASPAAGRRVADADETTVLRVPDGLFGPPDDDGVTTELPQQAAAAPEPGPEPAPEPARWHPFWQEPAASTPEPGPEPEPAGSVEVTPDPDPEPDAARQAPPLVPVDAGARPTVSEVRTQPVPEEGWSAPEPGRVPWARQVSTPGSGRDLAGALLGGDWPGAALAALLAVLVMAVLAVVGLLLLGARDAGVHVVLAGAAALVCAAFGGDLFAEAAGRPGAAEVAPASVGVLPLTLTAAGLTVLAVVHLRRTRGAGPRDLVLQGVRTAVVLGVLAAVLALLSRVRTASATALPVPDVRLGARLPSSVVGAVLFAVAALALAGLLARPGALPGPARRLRAALLAPLLAAAAVPLVGVLAALGYLVHELVTGDDRPSALGLGLLGLPDGGLGGLLVTLGVPWTGTGGLRGTAGQVVRTATGDSVTLLSVTERSAWWWLAPVVLAVALVLAATVLAVRHDTLAGARRDALHFAGCFAALCAVAALLVRIAGQGGSVYGSPSGALTFDPVAALLLGGLWALAAAVVAPQCAARLSGSMVQAVRHRFGSVPAPASDRAEEAA